MDVDYIGKSKRERQEQEQEQRQEQRQKRRQQQQGQEQKERARIAIKAKARPNSKGKGKGKPSNDKEMPRVREKGPSRTRLLVHEQNHDKMEKRGGSRRTQMPSLTRCVFYTIDHEVNVVDLSQSGCEVNNVKRKEKQPREWDPRTREQNSQGNGDPRNP